MFCRVVFLADWNRIMLTNWSLHVSTCLTEIERPRENYSSLYVRGVWISLRKNHHKVLMLIGLRWQGEAPNLHDLPEDFQYCKVVLMVIAFCNANLV